MITLVNHSDYYFAEKSLLTEIKKILKSVEKFYLLLHEKIEVAFINEKEISNLYFLYFKEQKTTDVLSFPEKKPLQKTINGSIAICIDTVFNYALADNRDLIKAFYETILHGILHLFGLEHDYSTESLEQVYRLQDRILNRLQLKKDVINEIIEKFNSHL